MPTFPIPIFRVHDSRAAGTRCTSTSEGIVSSRSGSRVRLTNSGDTLKTTGSHPNERRWGRLMRTRCRSGVLIGGKFGVTISTVFTLSNFRATTYSFSASSTDRNSFGTCRSQQNVSRAASRAAPFLSSKRRGFSSKRLRGRAMS